VTFGGDVDEFERLRPRLFGLAYRMFRSAYDAEDVVQDAWLRWAGVEREAIESAGLADSGHYPVVSDRPPRPGLVARSGRG
jgi:hypothetical protein